MKKKLLMIIGLLFLGLSFTSCDLSSLLEPSYPDESKEPENPDDSENQTPVIANDNLEVHFLELGNEYAGDSVYIKVGNGDSQIDILIDAGSRKGSATTIKTYVDQYCTDGKLEYVIATHAHQDHIAGFVGSNSGSTKTGIFYQYEVGTIIDFALTNATSQIYKDYLTARDYAVEKGATYYPASDCFNKENGAKDLYELLPGINFRVLYNKYYFEKSSDENNYSVCLLFTYGEEQMLFTGDLEKEGEEELAAYYTTNKGILGHCNLFKAGHHGSATSSNDCLLSLITPDTVVACCCAGTTEYTKNRETTFPTQAFIDRVALYTDAVYVTSVYDEETDDFKSLNGNVIITYSKDNAPVVSATNNTTKLKDSAWFSHLVYVDSSDKIVEKTAQGAKAVSCRTMPERWKS